MDEHPASSPAPITEADLHAYVDRQLARERIDAVEQYLRAQPAESARVADWAEQRRLLRSLLDPVLDEPVPSGLPLRRPGSKVAWRGLAAGVAFAALSAASAWWVRGSVDAERLAATTASPSELTGFARRAAVAHVVYSPDARRPVEVGAEQEQALVTWLTKRMGTAVRPPALHALGYELIGGRLLPGENGPVAQFMYGNPAGQRLTLYVTHEVPGGDTAFKFGRDGPVNVFYWVEDHFGYAISAGADRDTLMKVSQEVYRQLKPG